MKKNLSIFSLLLAIFVMTNAYAAESYYLEIGKPSSVEEVHEQWGDLSQKYKSMLGKLTFYPKSVIDEQGETNNIIQAGPITEKEKAQRICNRLFAKSIPCFVLEGVENAPPTMAIGMTRASNTASASGSFVFPWQGGEPAPQASSSTSHEAKVDVAQAIPVPLSDNKNNEYKDIGSFDDSKTKPLLVTENAPQPKSLVKISQAEFNSEETGALVIETFSSESEANKFWNYVNNEFPNMIDGLRIRVQRPLQMGSGDGIQVKVYPFATGDAAAAFCNQTVNGFGIALECHYEVSNAQNRTQTGAFQHTNGYMQRRSTFQRRVPSRQAELRTHRASIDIQELPETGKSYWAQVAIADSKAEATHRWDDIKKRNPALVKGVAGSLTTSSSAYAKYSMRLGSFDSEEEANELCEKLQAKGVDCLVITTR